MIYYGADPIVYQLAQEVRQDITAIPFEEHPAVKRDGEVVLQTRYGEFPIQIPNRYFLINLSAAHLACRQLGVRDQIFYEAMSAYSLSL